MLACGENEQNRQNFIQQVVNEHTSSVAYKAAVEAQAYYEGLNPTINKYEKLIYDMQGRAHTDMYTANHKIASQFFGRVIDQEVSYLLGNGVSFNEDGNKEKLGATFDQDVMWLTRWARIMGASFGFWNMDHLDKFKLTEFAPIYDEMTGALMAGVRFWQIDKSKPMRVTLYEPDGLTEYVKDTDGFRMDSPKRTYKLTVAVSPADGMEITGGENYDGFPIVPLYSNEQKTSELNGKRNTVDALDLASSNMVNGVDEGNLIYWVLKGYGGMDDLDDVKFMERLRTIHVAHVEGDDTSADAHTIEAPFAGTQATIDMLTKQLYADFQAFDSAAVTASNQSATAIKASYIPLDLKCDQVEEQVTRFILGVLELAGIEDQPSYTRNQITNTMETVQALTMGAEWLPSDFITEKILYLMGDADKVEDVLDQMSADELSMGGIGLDDDGEIDGMLEELEQMVNSLLEEDEE